MSPQTRRQFVARTAAAAAAVLAPRAFAAADPRFKIIAFSKPFAELSSDDTADLVADIGWDGIECPVRTKAGQIAPEKVEEDLPKMVEALKKRGQGSDDRHHRDHEGRSARGESPAHHGEARDQEIPPRLRPNTRRTSPSPKRVREVGAR